MLRKETQVFGPGSSTKGCFIACFSAACLYIILDPLLLLQGIHQNGSLLGASGTLVNVSGVGFVDQIVSVDRKSTLRSFYKDTYSVHKCESSLFKRRGSEPSFIVAGVHKGGSTAIFGYLARHGHVRPACCKEINFFTDDRLFNRGMNYYRLHFPDLSHNDTNHVLTGEGTPNYIRNPVAPRRIKNKLPRAKIIISLRDPVARYVSHYVGAIENKRFKGTCDKFLQNELNALKVCKGQINETRTNQRLTFQNDPESTNEFVVDVGARCKLEKRCNVHECLTEQYEAALSRGVYVDQIERWLKHFPSERILVVQAEQLFKETEVIMQEVAQFLGLRKYTHDELLSFKRTFKGSNHLSNPLEQTCNRTILREFYHEHNELLYELLHLNWPKIGQKWMHWQ